ncbi:ATP-binding protein [Butyrivibrio sp. VCB2006]|uniref:ATP-binding protein n=1 Tax=Butyrivibrio sp. VCB2006 TaxID=1280679 RepID=UPI0003F96388|nr:ATP-binding protein [Butyrivibrio sp. VCB2006]
MALTNAQYDAIMHEYEERRSLHRQELEDRQRYVYDNVPGYKDLEDAIATTSVNFGKRLLSGERLDRSALRNEIAELSKQKLTLLTEAGFSSDYLDMGYTCQDCKDTGYIGNEKCHCFKQKIIEALYDKSNLKALTKTANFRLLSEKYYQGEDLKRFQGAVRNSEDFVKNFDSDYQNLFIYGTVGTGKTFLSICVANELLKKGHSVIYFSSLGLFTMLGEYAFDYKAKQELHDIYEDLYNCELLLIDDLGTERPTSFVLSELFSLLNERDLRKKSTIITTNLSLEDLQAIYSDRISSRIISNYKLFKLSGQDIRKLKKIAKKESEDLQ